MTRERRGRLASIVLLASVSVLYAVLPLHSLEPSKAWIVGLVFLVNVVLVAWLVVRQALIFRLGGGHGPGQLRGLITAVWFAVLFFAYTYYSLSYNDPREISGIVTKLDALYYTLTIVSTVGFGDITADGQAARSIVCVNIVFNLVIIALAVSSIQQRTSASLSERERAGHQEAEDGQQPG